MANANFGETLTYWYLRLNGFFPLSDFVLHQGDALRHSGDCDLVAIRLPGVYEEVGGQPGDWDLPFFERAGLLPDQDTIGVIAEVKTGYEARQRDLANRVRDAFRIDKLQYAVPRLGIWDRRTALERVVPSLVDAPLFMEANPNGPGRLVVAKLFVGSRLPAPEDLPACLAMDLDAVDNFLRRRFTGLAFRKYADRTFFPNELMQYIIWQCAA